MTSVRRFADQVAVVTGAAAGIGAASAARLAAEGAITVLADIDQDGAAQQAARIVAAGGVAVAEHCDVGRLASWQELARRVAARFGRVDVIHNNAFTVERLAADALSESSWDRQIAVNLSSIYYCVQVLLALMTGPAPAIVNTASVHAMIGVPHYPAYAAAKGGIVALTRQLAVEYGPRIRVNSVAPGPIHTQTWRNVPEHRGQAHGAARGCRGRRGVPGLRRRGVYYGHNPPGRRRLSGHAHGRCYVMPRSALAGSTW
jgi:NAD(P)-dependent dehydrogenase (short-subunit alcohol dehydrogenase family)